jgi:hypothetical protein
VAKKADLEASFRAAQARCAEAAAAEAEWDYLRALAKAEAALPLVRHASAYLRRYQKVAAPNLPAVDLILRCAPAVFARRSLDAVEQWFAAAGRTERTAYPDLMDRLANARWLLDLTVWVWPALPPTAPPRLTGAESAHAAQFLDLWRRMGAVADRPGSAPATYQPVTHLRRQVRGKCPHCGRTTEAAWAELLFPVRCPHCRATAVITVVARLA